MNTVFDPALLFISDAQWSNEAKRDQFLDHLSGHLRMIEDYQLSKIFWSDDLEEFLWAHPQLPPWRAAIYWKNQIVPIIARLFAKNLLLVHTSDCISGCEIAPVLSMNYGREDIHLMFRRLMHAIIRQELEFRFNPGVENTRDRGTFTFSCECHGRSIEARVINYPKDWLSEIDFNSFWPSTPDEAEILRKAIGVVIIRDMNGKTADTKHKFEFDRRFMQDVTSERDSRTEVVRALAKRLQMSQAEAAADNGLQDEGIFGRDERRMRVSLAKRIHYRYLREGGIRFLRFYGEGMHYDGLG